MSMIHDVMMGLSCCALLVVVAFAMSLAGVLGGHACVEATWRRAYRRRCKAAGRELKVRHVTAGFPRAKHPACSCHNCGMMTYLVDTKCEHCKQRLV